MLQMLLGFFRVTGLCQSPGDVREDPPHRVGRGRTGLVLSAGDTLLHLSLRHLIRLQSFSCFLADLRHRVRVLLGEKRARVPRVAR